MGSYGVVYRGVFSRGEGGGDDASSANGANYINCVVKYAWYPHCVNERDVYSALQNHRHPNIIEMYMCVVKRTRIEFVLEYARGADMFVVVMDDPCGGEKMKPHLRSCIDQLLSGVAFLHSVGVGHYDLKPENIIVDLSPRGVSLKIIDMGFAVVGGATIFTDKRLGSPTYAAPEVLLTIRGERAGYIDVKAADVWSVGVIIHIVCTRKTPYRFSEWKQLIPRGKFPRMRVEKSPHMGDIGELLKRIFVIMPQTRITSKDALDLFRNEIAITIPNQITPE
jgi:serine/threonine protein kinase